MSTKTIKFLTTTDFIIYITTNSTDLTQKKKSKEIVTCRVCEDSIAGPSNKSDGDDFVL